MRMRKVERRLSVRGALTTSRMARRSLRHGLVILDYLLVMPRDGLQHEGGVDGEDT
jgi:hypothetical protein